MEKLTRAQTHVHPCCGVVPHSAQTPGRYTKDSPSNAEALRNSSTFFCTVIFTAWIFYMSLVFLHEESCFFFYIFCRKKRSNRTGRKKGNQAEIDKKGKVLQMFLFTSLNINAKLGVWRGNTISERYASQLWGDHCGKAHICPPWYLVLEMENNRNRSGHCGQMLCF